MQSAHKQMLIEDIRMKMEKVEQIKTLKKRFVEHNSRKNLVIRDLTVEAIQKHDNARAA